MDMQTLQVYYGRANYGELSAKEFNEVAALLDRTSDDSIRAMCIAILGWDGEADHSALVEKFLHDPDPIVQEEVVRFLISDARRLDLCYSKFMDWLSRNPDDDFHVLPAVQVAGDAYKITQDPHILKRLLHFLKSPSEAFSESAKDSLIKALNHDYDDQTPEAKRFRASKPTIDDYKNIAEEILRQAKH